MIGRPPRPLIDRFWDRVEKTDLCWLWGGATDKQGYGKIRGEDLAHLRAHRVSWELHYGAIADRLGVLHSCDNPGCVRPDHLFLGTTADNHADRQAKNRQPFGERNGGSKLTEADVIMIRRERKLNKPTQQELADKYNVCQQSISHILNGRTWAHLRDS